MKEFIDKLIERLKERHEEVRNDYLYGKGNLAVLDGTMRGIEDAHAIIKSLEKEYKGGWIACSERLPEADHYVLCQGNHSMFVACVDSFDGEWRDNHFYKRTTVKAWCELPAPYTEGEKP